MNHVDNNDSDVFTAMTYRLEKTAFRFTLMKDGEMIVTSTDPYDKLTDAQICEVLFRRGQEVAQ